MRDRDELAAALEVRDRIKYDLNTPEREEILSTGDLIVEVNFIQSGSYHFKGPCSPKRLCTHVLLFSNGSFVECSVLIGCYFPGDNFQLCKIPTNHSG